jgi:hypothetical protein
VLIAKRNRAAFKPPNYALAGHRLEILGGRERQPALFSACDNRSRQRMLTASRSRQKCFA